LTKKAVNRLHWRISDIKEEARIHIVASCKDNGCEMKNGPGIKRCIKINTENFWIKSKKNGKVTDFLVFCVYSDRRKVTIIEMKTHRPDIKDIVEKFKCVCSEIGEFIETCTLEDYDFYPIILSKSMPPEEARQLRSAPKITLGKKSEKIITEHCGDSMDYIFKKYS